MDYINFFGSFLVSSVCIHIIYSDLKLIVAYGDPEKNKILILTETHFILPNYYWFRPLKDLYISWNSILKIYHFEDRGSKRLWTRELYIYYDKRKAVIDLRYLNEHFNLLDESFNRELLSSIRKFYNRKITKNSFFGETTLDGNENLQRVVPIDSIIFSRKISILNFLMRLLSVIFFYLFFLRCFFR